MSERLVKKADIDRAGMWVRPVRFQSHFSEESNPPQQTDEEGLGKPPGLGEASAQLGRIRNLLHDLTTQLAHDKQRLLDELLPHIVQLAVTVARRIVAAEICQDRRIVERTVEAALEDLIVQGELLVRVHPDDRAIVHQALETDQTRVGRFSQLRVIADPSVERGDCILESDHGIVDANIPTQFAQIERTLLSYIEQ